MWEKREDGDSSFKCIEKKRTLARALLLFFLNCVRIFLSTQPENITARVMLDVSLSPHKKMLSIKGPKALTFSYKTVYIAPK